MYVCAHARGGKWEELTGRCVLITGNVAIARHHFSFCTLEAVTLYFLTMYTLGERNICAAVSFFQGAPRIHIRKYEADRISGDVRPTKKGITLTVAEWSRLKEAIVALDNDIARLQASATHNDMSSIRYRPIYPETTISANVVPYAPESLCSAAANVNLGSGGECF